MISRAKIAIRIPDSDKPERFFSFRLRSDLYNEPCIYQKPAKIIVVSDIEGNFQALCKLLIKNKVIDKYFNWVFDEGHLIILGDCFDRGEQVIECLWLIYSLEEKANRWGGYVHYILGNHEVMNMNGDWRYIHPKYAVTAVKDGRYSTTALYDGNNELWRWLSTKNILEKIGDILFVHGGISEEINNLGYSVEEINRISRPFYAQTQAVYDNKVLELILKSEQGPLWYRGYYDGKVTVEQINNTLLKFDVRTIITGHTTKDKITSYFEGKVINVNTDHSKENSQGLMIINDRYYLVDRRGMKESL